MKEPFPRKHKERTCILCKESFRGYGANAAPLAEGICCDECDVKKVIPERLTAYGIPEKEAKELAALRLSTASVKRW